MKLSEWAKKQGISYRTAWRWFKAGKIEGAKQEESGTILVSEQQYNTPMYTLVCSIVDKLNTISSRLEQVEKRLKEKL